MSDTRNRRSDSNAAAIVAAQNAAQGPREPLGYAPIPDAALPFWTAIMRARPRHKWIDADLVGAATLARLQLEIVQIMDAIASEPLLIDGKVNPLQPLLEKKVRLAIALAAQLHVHPEATEGRSQNQGKAAELERQAEGNVHHLIPRVS